MRLLAEEGLDDLLNLGHAGLSADQDHLVDLRRLEPRVLQRLFHRRQGPLHQIVDQLLELGPGQRHVEMLGAGLVGRDERQVDFGGHGGRQLHLGFFRGLFQPLQRHRVLGEIDALIFLELGHQPIDDPLVEVVTTQVGVAVGAFHLEHALGQLQHRDVVGAAAEVVDRHLLFLFLVQAVGECRCGRLVDDPHHIQPGDASGVFGRLALGVVEVGGDGNHGFLDLVAEIVLRRLLHFLEDHGRDLGRRVGLAGDVDRCQPVGAGVHLVGNALELLGDFFHAPAHEALDRKDGVLGVGDGLSLGDLPDQPLAVFRERHDRWGGTPTFGVGNHDRVSAFHHGDYRVGRPEVDADHFLSHFRSAPHLRIGKSAHFD